MTVVYSRYKFNLLMWLLFPALLGSEGLDWTLENSHPSLKCEEMAVLTLVGENKTKHHVRLSSVSIEVSSGLDVVKLLPENHLNETLASYPWRCHDGRFDEEVVALFWIPKEPIYISVVPGNKVQFNFVIKRVSSVSRSIKLQIDQNLHNLDNIISKEVELGFENEPPKRLDT